MPTSEEQTPGLPWRKTGRTPNFPMSRSATTPSLQDALAAYLAKLPPTTRPTEAAIAVAAPVFGDNISLTNHGWSFSIKEFQRNLGLTSLRVFNDFAATAMAVPHLPEKDVFLVGPACPNAQGPIGILGPGTGLGVCSLIPHAGEWTVVPGEGGHVTLPTSTALEDQIATFLRTRWQHVSAERVLSGSGLVNLYQALCTIEGSTPREFSPADVTDHAIKKNGWNLRQGIRTLLCVSWYRCGGFGVDDRCNRRGVYCRRDPAAFPRGICVVRLPGEI